MIDDGDGLDRLSGDSGLMSRDRAAVFWIELDSRARCPTGAIDAHQSLRICHQILRLTIVRSAVVSLGTCLAGLVTAGPGPPESTKSQQITDTLCGPMLSRSEEASATQTVTD